MNRQQLENNKYISKYYQMKKSIVLFLSLFILILISLHIQAQRQIETINSGWRFYKGNIENAISEDINTANWETVNIPHTWNIDAYTKKDYYRGVGWYRKSLFIPDITRDKQIFIKFEGVNAAAEIYINGKKAASHLGGYTAFTVDATAFIEFGRNNLIAVKADNSKLDIPPLSGDFSIFGGIYRDVWLITTEKQHIDMLNAGSDGIFIETPSVSKNAATVVIRGDIKNEAEEKKTVNIINEIVDPDGKVIFSLNNKLVLSAEANTPFNFKISEIKNPKLWASDSPNLYEVRTTIIDPKTKKLLDFSFTPVGLRWFEFKGSEGFYLNGESLKLIGVCRHQDQMLLGNALSDDMHRRDIKLIKEMGANFLRIAHYPQDNAILEQCDKLGILVWEEIPIVDIVSLDPQFEDVCHTNLKEMIRQHYNHPSVIMWGYMNEPVLVTVRTLSGNYQEQIFDKTREIAINLEKTLHKEDSFRASAIAFHGSEIYHEIGLSGITDIIGWNLYQGWYGGDFDGFDKFMENQNSKFPSHNLIISEYGAGADKRLHTLNPESFDFSIEHQQAYHEHYLPVIANNRYITGSTVWNFIDFGSASRDESMPRINNKGLVYADRTPKDIYYYYKAFLRKDIPVLHIASNDWSRRTGIQEDTKPVILPVKVYTNLPEVELFINGISLGTKKVDNFHAVWDVPFTGGKHYFTAKGAYNTKLIETGMPISFSSVSMFLNKENIRNLELAINVGGNCFYTGEESGLTWVADKEYTEGSWGYVGGDMFRTSKFRLGTQIQINNTVDNPLFQTLRTGIEEYRFDVPDGTYELELLFADVFAASSKVVHNLTEGEIEEKENIFDIYLNDNPLFLDFNIAKEYGHFNAVTKKIMVKVDSNKGIRVQFKASKGNSFLNGIKLRRYSMN